jgi:hypothetical protein
MNTSYPSVEVYHLKKWIKNPLIQHKDGVAAVEFAIILPILLLIVFGIINFGVLMFDQAVITNAAREGARWAAINAQIDQVSGIPCSSRTIGSSTPCEVANQYAKNYLITFGTNAGPTSTFTGFTTPKELIEVRVQYTYTGIGWFPNIAIGNLSSISRMYHE